MAITYPITMPLGADGRTLIQSLQMGVVSKVGVSESPFTFKQQIQDYNDSRWEGTITTRPLYGADILAMRGFILSMKGRKGIFEFSVPQNLSNDYELGSAYNSEDDMDIAIKSGVTPSHAMTAGTYFQLGVAGSRRLFMTIEDRQTAANTAVVPSGFGQSSGGGSDLITINPLCRAKLMDNTTMYGVDITEGHSFTFAFHGV